jgi:hypothetical protein
MNIHPIRTFIGAVLLVLRLPFAQAILPGLVRVSFGIENDEADVDALVQALERIALAPRSRGERRMASTYNGTCRSADSAIRERIAAFVTARVKRVYSFGAPNAEASSDWTYVQGE